MKLQTHDPRWHRFSGVRRLLLGARITAVQLLAGILCVVSGMSVEISAADGPVEFRTQVAPILEQHCLRCHSTNISKGDIALDTITALNEQGYIQPGNGAASELIALVSPDGSQPPRMPESGPPLTAAQIDTLRLWIDQGARWPEGLTLREPSRADASWWSLQPPGPIPLPDAETIPLEWRHNPIDRFVYTKLREQGLSAAPLADRSTLLRRWKFTLHGLPPTPEQLEAFSKNESADAVSDVVNELLAAPQFGERMAQHWLDIAHYADTHGFERDQRRDNAWRYRDYVIRAFNDDKPYAQFLREQIAGDALAPDNPDAVIATGFLAAGPWDFVGQVETKSPILKRASRALDLDDIVTQVLTVTSGMTVNCARCHDHKLDPITQREYYQLCAVFAGVQRGERDVNPQHRQQYERRKAELERQLATLQSQRSSLQGMRFDLADLVGGGEGYGTGQKGSGLSLETGQPQRAFLGALDNVQPGRFLPVPHPLIDGVFVPSSPTGSLSSTGVEYSNLPQHSGRAWDAVRHGPVNSQFSTVLGKIDYQSEGHSLLGLHANAGITFDLQAIREQTGQTPAEFSCVVGYGGRTETPSAEFLILLDGVPQQQGRIGRNDAVAVALKLTDADRFLTFIATDGGDGYSHDQVCFGDPRISWKPQSPEAADVSRQVAELDQQIRQLQTERDQLPAPDRFYGLVTQAPPPIAVLHRGDPESPAETVLPGPLNWGQTPIEFGPGDLTDAQRRVALAEWITAPEHQLVARVIVNRIWQWHFGAGLVDTPSDFGYGGGRPSHPELLDWLATELRRNNGSLKHIHRLIVTSRTFQSVSAAGDDAQLHEQFTRASKIDSQNRLLWRMNPRRLDAEAVRDSVLSVSGKLNPEMFGPGYRDFAYQEAYAPIYTYQPADAPEQWRRSIYRFVVRTTPNPFLTTFDCPDPASLTATRNVTTTPLQSLALYNNEFMLRQARYFATRLTNEFPEAPEQRIDRAFLLAFGRQPTDVERHLSLQLIDHTSLGEFCRSLLNANEFLYVD